MIANPGHTDFYMQTLNYNQGSDTVIIKGTVRSNDIGLIQIVGKKKHQSGMMIHAVIPPLYEKGELVS